MALEITEYVSIKDKGSIVGFVSFYIPEWKLHLRDCKMIRKQNGGFFIGFPSKKVNENYVPYFSFDKEVNEKFQESAKKAIDLYIKDNYNKDQLNLGF